MNIENLKNNKYFQSQTLEVGELLFSEGDFDDFLYIIISGKLQIEKYTDKEKTEQKLLAYLGAGEIFGEGSLGKKKAKEVNIRSEEKTELLKIHAKDFESFISEFPKFGKEILQSIIQFSNTRLLEANFLITNTYKISKKISEQKDFDNKALFSIIDFILEILGNKYILVFEKNPVLKNYLKFEYDSRSQGKIQTEFFELQEDFSVENLKNIDIKLEKNNFIVELINGSEIIGYLVFGEEDNQINETQKKMIHSISVSLAGFIKQKQLGEEEHNKKRLS